MPKQQHVCAHCDAEMERRPGANWAGLVCVNPACATSEVPERKCTQCSQAFVMPSTPEALSARIREVLASVKPRPIDPAASQRLNAANARRSGIQARTSICV